MHLLQIAEYIAIDAWQVEASDQRVPDADTLGDLLPPVVEQVSADITTSRVDAPKRVIDDSPSLIRRHQEPPVVVDHRRDDRDASAGQPANEPCRPGGVPLLQRRQD